MHHFVTKAKVESLIHELDVGIPRWACVFLAESDTHHNLDSEVARSTCQYSRLIFMGDMNVDTVPLESADPFADILGRGARHFEKSIQLNGLLDLEAHDLLRSWPCLLR